MGLLRFLVKLNKKKKLLFCSLAIFNFHSHTSDSILHHYYKFIIKYYFPPLHIFNPKFHNCPTNSQPSKHPQCKQCCTPITQKTLSCTTTIAPPSLESSLRLILALSLSSISALAVR